VITRVSQDWLESLPGRVLVAAHAAVRKAPEKASSVEESALLFDGNLLTGSQLRDELPKRCSREKK
jgi:hypothetical protein